MVRFGFDDQDFFEIDPVRCASALGEAGLPAYRDAVDARRDRESFAVRYGQTRVSLPAAYIARSRRGPGKLGGLVSPV
jgi:hypothetical protein